MGCPAMPEPVRVAVLGASGRVGRLLVASVLADPRFTLVAAVATARNAGRDAGELAGGRPAGLQVCAPGAGCFADAQVVVDFSLPGGLLDALPFVEDRALVTGTTGLDGPGLDALSAQSGRGPLLQAANFSTGVALLEALVATAARALPDYDVEIVETHHRHKLDAPSGTALFLARAAAEARGQNLEAVRVDGRSGLTGVRPAGQIGVHAVRMGEVVGEHQVWLAGPAERVQIGHAAASRQAFVDGALRAASWIVGRPPGRYTLRDVLGL